MRLLLVVSDTYMYAHKQMNYFYWEIDYYIWIIKSRYTILKNADRAAAVEIIPK